MKVIAIELNKSKTIVYVLHRDETGMLTSLMGDFKYLNLENDTDNATVRAFQSSIHSFFDSVRPHRIAILKRQTKGRFRAAPLSFKMEGLIQCYEKVDIEFIQPMAVSNYFKKHSFTLSLEFEYQEAAAKLACFMLA